MWARHHLTRLGVPIRSLSEATRRRHQRDRDRKSTIFAAIIVDKTELLLVRRRHPEGTLVWTFPSGKIETGEAPTDAAVRETLEEIGMTVRATTVLGQRVHPTTGLSITYAACTPVRGAAHVAAPRRDQ